MRCEVGGSCVSFPDIHFVTACALSFNIRLLPCQSLG
jgi:hypothetical protein